MEYFFVVCKNCNESYLTSGKHGYPKVCEECENRKIKVYKENEFVQCLRCGKICLGHETDNHVCRTEDIEEYRIFDDPSAPWHDYKELDNDNIEI